MIAIPLFWASLWALHGLIVGAFEVATTFHTELFFGYGLIADVLGALFALTWAVAVTGLVIRRRWLASALTLSAIFCGSVASLSPWSPVDAAARWRLWRERPKIDRQIAAFPAEPGHRRLEWDWGATGLASTSAIFFTLVYDEADQLPTQIGSETARWERYGILFPKDASVMRALGDHFYLVSTFQ